MYKTLFVLCIFGVGLKSVSAISCYQCNGTDAKSLFQCGEDLGAAGGSIDLVPQSCDKVHDAKFCVKHVGRYEGGIGAKRFCSSKDLGNYCNYVKNPGDQLTYRSCIFTCNTDGCNSAISLVNSSSLLIIFSVIYQSIAFFM
ncbi:uncharacterized protein LOC113389339 [Ctenocephalides felis]|uniref:uncharacterized protein LOC113389339 n=1 Tax=Ctenocephalides felis TaxID=7515 RepID=UPI000E6E3846|nr:uncharacterized protein LOC113389339 [Ctenocephalides felis]